MCDMKQLKSNIQYTRQAFLKVYLQKKKDVTTKSEIVERANCSGPASQVRALTSRAEGLNLMLLTWEMYIIFTEESLSVSPVRSHPCDLLHGANLNFCTLYTCDALQYMWKQTKKIYRFRCIAEDDKITANVKKWLARTIFLSIFPKMCA